MSVCPFCKGAVANAGGPCPRCGRRAADHPSVAGAQAPSLPADFDDDLDMDGGLDLVSGSNVHDHVQGSTYESTAMSSFDDDDEDGRPGHALELDMPPVPQPPQAPDLAAPPTSATPATSTPSGASPASVRRMPVEAEAAPSSRQLHDEPPAPASAALPPSKPDPAAIIARYPTAPAELWWMPVYAWKVLYRQFELRMDLTSLRRRRSPDVPLYERALRVYEPRAFRIGLAITCVLLAFGSFVFFLPVILRFARASD